MSARILVIEDNADLAQGIAYNLKLEGYEVRITPDGRAGLDAAVRWAPDAILLDLMLPGLDGFEVLRALRTSGSRTPVIILSARAEEADKVRGFKLDADQYVTKPFGVLELLERVAALLRRAGHAAKPSEETLTFGDVRIDLARRTVA
ncbi:MAG TPA: response regulator transcription factor, partial [Gemmatimonadales bacterium]|nr:response regulator transcription factor [Gemmatimonadales bacterium]